MACQVHLGQTASDDAVDIFLGKTNCLYVWVDPKLDVARVGDTLPDRHKSAVAFLGLSVEDDEDTAEGEGAEGEGAGAKPKLNLQCITLQPTVTVADEPEGEGGEDEAGVSSQSALLQALQLYTRHLFLPAVKQTSASESSTLLQDKIRELDVAIGQSQRSTRLPHVQLLVDPTILQVASTIKDPSKNLDWDALGLAGRLADDDYLNKLQSGVSQWITQIRKVTVLPRSTSFPMISEETNADLEEIAFWSQLQTELQSIQAQLASPGVVVTLAMLREAKRFVATLALENNTGLDQAVSYTQDVDHFLKPYPIVQFQAARDFEKISQATNAIFDHLPKIRSSRYYSLERSARLLEATTLTLRKTLTSVLQDQYSNFLFMDYKEYESKVRYPTQDVFVQFEDRWEQFKEFFLDQARRRKVASPAKQQTKVSTPVTAPARKPITAPASAPAKKPEAKIAPLVRSSSASSTNASSSAAQQKPQRKRITAPEPDRTPAPPSSGLSAITRPLSAPVSSSSKEICRYWPGCTRGTSCFYFHPKSDPAVPPKRPVGHQPRAPYSRIPSKEKLRWTSASTMP